MEQVFKIETNFIKNERSSFSSEQFQILLGSKCVIWTQWCSRKIPPDCMSLLERKHLCTWGGPKFTIWWNRRLRRLVFGLQILSFQIFYTTRSITGCRRNGKARIGPFYGYVIGEGWLHVWLIKLKDNTFFFTGNFFVFRFQLCQHLKQCVLRCKTFCVSFYNKNFGILERAHDAAGAKW